jgi:hypothetical protein
MAILAILSKALEPNTKIHYYTAGDDIYPFFCHRLVCRLSYPQMEGAKADTLVASDLYQTRNPSLVGFSRLKLIPCCKCFRVVILVGNNFIYSNFHLFEPHIKNQNLCRDVTCNVSKCGLFTRKLL